MKHFFLTILIICSQIVAYSQTNDSQEPCEKYMSADFISDGQYYNSPISFGETKKFKLAFIGGNTYRLALCSTYKDNLNFWLYDQDNNLLFSNVKFQNTPYWDFEFTNTMECTLKVSLISEQIVNDFVTVSVGFQK